MPGAGWAEIQLPTGHAVRLGGATRLQIRTLPAPSGGEAEIVLDRGVAWIAGERVLPASPVRVALGSAVVSLISAARVRLDVAEDGTVQVAVARGEGRVDTPEERLPVSAGQALRLRPGQARWLGAFRATDEGDRWSDGSDGSAPALDRDPSRAHLPPALAPYAAELTAHGRWFTVPEQGYAWAPTVELGWTPFREGRWRWWRDESVWMPDEPWGWAPAHYGRWLFVSGVGWVWLPPEERVGERILTWHPGAVAWLSGPSFVAWVPLAPSEPDDLDQPEAPVGAGVTNIFVTQINVASVFVNARAPHGVVVSSRDAFVAGRRPPAASTPSRNVFAGGGRRTPRLPASLRPPSASEPERRSLASEAPAGRAPAGAGLAGDPGARLSGRPLAPAGAGSPRGFGSPAAASPGAPGVAGSAPPAGPAGLRGMGPAAAGSVGASSPSRGSGVRPIGGLTGGLGTGGSPGRGGGPPGLP